MLSSLDKHRFFQRTVDEKILADYLSIITTPMDFETMEKKAKQGCYQTNPSTLLYKDFSLIPSNAFSYNMPRHTVFKEANKLLIFGEKAFQKYSKVLDKEVSRIGDGYIPPLTNEKQKFLKEIEMYYLDYLYERNPGANPDVRILLKDLPQNRMKPYDPMQSQKQKLPFQGKEIVVLIQGFSKLMGNAMVKG